MSEFELIKKTLKPKWLDYYKSNLTWIKPLMDTRGWWCKTPDGGKRPCADIMLGAITALEPKLALWMPPFCELNSNGDKLVEVLGLHFDPEMELKKIEQELLSSQTFADPHLQEILEKNRVN